MDNDDEFSNKCRKKYMRLADMINESGFANEGARVEYRETVGKHLLELSPYKSEVAGMNLNTASFCVLAYLHHSRPIDNNNTDIDFGSFRNPGAGTWLQRDVLDALRTLAAHWRDLQQVPSAYVRALEGVAGSIAADEDRAWPPDALEDVCMMLGYVWALEYTWKTLIQDRWVDFEASPEVHAACMKWCAEAKDLAKRAKRAGNMSLRLGRALVFLGEKERYARMNGGVKAADVTTTFDVTRTHVQTRAIGALLARVDMAAASRLAALSYVDRYVKTRCSFDMLDFAFVIDTDFISAPLRAISACRTTPWIMLFGRDYYVFFRDQPCLRCPDAVHAAVAWFKIMQDEYDLVLPDGLDTHDLTKCARDSTFPFV